MRVYVCLGSISARNTLLQYGGFRCRSAMEKVNSDVWLLLLRMYTP